STGRSRHGSVGSCRGTYPAGGLARQAHRGPARVCENSHPAPPVPGHRQPVQPADNAQVRVSRGFRNALAVAEYKADTNSIGSSSEPTASERLQVPALPGEGFGFQVRAPLRTESDSEVTFTGLARQCL